MDRVRLRSWMIEELELGLGEVHYLEFLEVFGS